MNYHSKKLRGRTYRKAQERPQKLGEEKDQIDVESESLEQAEYSDQDQPTTIEQKKMRRNRKKKGSTITISIKQFFLLTSVATICASILLLSALHLGGITFIKNSTYDKLYKTYNDFGRLEEVYGLIEENSLYKDKAYDAENRLCRYLVSLLEDEYSEYMTEDEFNRWLSELAGNVSGIGVELKLEDGKVTIVHVMEDGPAKAAGLKVGDKILEVDGKTYETYDDFVLAIRGNSGTKVKLKVQSGSQEKNVEIVRADVKERTAFPSELEDGIGYIRISSFSQDTARDFKKELEIMESKNKKGLVIDLRGNGGGLIDEGIAIADAILPEGKILTIVDSSGRKEIKNSGPSHTKMKVAVLIDENTASTSEILSLALKDGGIPLVGHRTYGKGIIQSTFNLSDGSGLKLTTMKYLGPKDEFIQGNGIEPNYLVDGDKQLETAISLVK